jgi:predicted ATPase
VRWIEAELHRIRGELMLAQDMRERREAETCLHEALRITRGQGARLWELRSATCLARLWFELGRREQARDLLAPIHGWFSEGFDTPDLRDSRALLSSLN